MTSLDTNSTPSTLLDSVAEHGGPMPDTKVGIYDATGKGLQGVMPTTTRNPSGDTATTKSWTLTQPRTATAGPGYYPDTSRSVYVKCQTLSALRGSGFAGPTSTASIVPGWNSSDLTSSRYWTLMFWSGSAYGTKTVTCGSGDRLVVYVLENQQSGTTNGTRRVFFNMTSLDTNSTPSTLLNSVPEHNSGG